MCDKHAPIVIYDSGGTQKVCGKCGKPLEEWKSNGESKKHKKKSIK